MCQGNKLQKVRDDVPRPVLRRRHLREPRRGLRRRHGQGRRAADRRHLQHVPAAVVRPDLPGSRAAEPAGRLLPRPRRAGRGRRPDASRRLRPRLHAGLPEHGRHGPGRRARRRPDARLRAGHMPRRSRSAIPRRASRRSTATSSPIELGQAEVLEWETDGMLLACGTLVGDLRAGGRAAPRAARPAGRRGQRPVRQAARPDDGLQGGRGVPRSCSPSRKDA